MYGAMFKHPLVTVLCLATIASAASLTDTTTALLQSLNSRQNIYRRQSGSSTTIPLSAFPQQCQSGCALAINALNTCTTTKCICTKAVEGSLQGCLTCSTTAVPTTNALQSAGAVAQSYDQTCAGSGVSSITVASGSATGTSTTSGNSTLSGTSTSSSSGSSSSSAVSTTSASVPSVSPITPTISTPSSTLPPTTVVSTTSTPSTTSAGIATASANVGYLSFTVLVTLLAALMA